MKSNATTGQYTWFTWVSHGGIVPRGIFRTPQEANEAWTKFNLRSSGLARTLSLGSARLYACKVRALARTADISLIRPNEVVWRHA